MFDEYDAGRPDVMFVIQRVLEVSGRLTLLDQNKVIHPHPAFRLFSTTNTIGLGDTTGLYHGTQQINQGQMDRWNIVTTLNYLPHDDEVNIVLAKAHHYAPRRAATSAGRGCGLPRTLPSNALRQRRSVNGDEPARGDHVGRKTRRSSPDIGFAFRVTFLNKCEEVERSLVAGSIGAASNAELTESTVNAAMS